MPGFNTLLLPSVAPEDKERNTRQELVEPASASNGASNDAASTRRKTHRRPLRDLSGRRMNPQTL